VTGRQKTSTEVPEGGAVERFAVPAESDSNSTDEIEITPAMMRAGVETRFLPPYTRAQGGKKRDLAPAIIRQR